MLKKTILLSAALLMIAATPFSVKADDSGFAYMHDLRKERGKLCFSGHFHYGSSGTGHRTKAKAKRAAIVSWQDFTDFEYGSDWARFSRAAGRSISCDKSSGSWSCDVSARPCASYRKRKKY